MASSCCSGMNPIQAQINNNESRLYIWIVLIISLWYAAGALLCIFQRENLLLMNRMIRPKGPF